MTLSCEQMTRLHRVAETAALPCDAPLPEIVFATAVETTDEPDAAAGDELPACGLADLLEMILKRPARLDRLVRDPRLQGVLLPRLLGISLVGFVFFGVALALVFSSAGQWPRLTAIRALVAGEATSAVAFETLPAALPTAWVDGSAAALIAAYAIGLVAATGICLPSLYFYGLLAGVRMSMLDVVVLSLRSKAAAAVGLVGILPIYAALALAIVVFPVPQIAMHATFWLGLVLPFVAGLFGTWSLYRGLAGFADTLPADRRSDRACFLRRLVVSWAACYTAVTPIMIHTLWVFFDRT